MTMEKVEAGAEGESAELACMWGMRGDPLRDRLHTREIQPKD